MPALTGRRQHEYKPGFFMKHHDGNMIISGFHQDDFENNPSLISICLVSFIQSYSFI
jgi:hypothetical protein